MSGSGDSTKHIVQSLLVNTTIAIVKAIAAVFTKSGAMLAEALHSAADCGNQVLLLVGVRGARRPPTPSHPLGYGRDVYFWSFMVSLLLFSGGGVFSIYEGIHKIMHPEKVEKAWIGYLILGFSLVLEGFATYGNVKELNHRRAGKPFFQYLRDTKDSDLVVVFGENAAAVLGLALAMIALFIAAQTGDGRWDGIGSFAIGLVLVGVAIFLAVEVKSLLLGEAADVEIEKAVHALVAEHKDIEQVLRLVTVQQGPGEVMVMMKLAFPAGMVIDETCREINEFEAKLRALRPEVRWCFIEPDIPHGR
jgi:cation diffusion facilitator family transporter